MTDVGGVADLAHLAVVDDVYPALPLLVDDVFDRTPHGAFEGRRIEPLVAVLREEQIHYRLGPRQAAGVSRQNPIGVPVHSMFLVPAAAVSPALLLVHSRRRSDVRPRA